LNKNIKFVYLFLSFLIITLGFEVFYFKLKKYDVNLKKRVVAVLTMPDFSLCSDAFYIRHRSLSSFGDSFFLSPSLLAYFPSDFVYMPPKYKVK